MKLNITGKNIEITDAIRDYIEKRVERFEKFESKNTDVSVICGIEREEQIVEMQVNYNGEFIKIEERNPDLYASIDLATDRVERQMRKEKEKRTEKNRDDSFKDKFLGLFKGIEHVENGEITKTKCYDAKPMSIDDAKMKLHEKNDMFITFINIENNQVNVLYDRGDGTYGIVIPE